MSKYIEPFESREFVKLTEEELLECKSIIVKIEEMRNEATTLLGRLNVIRYGTEHPYLIKEMSDRKIKEPENPAKKRGAIR